MDTNNSSGVGLGVSSSVEICSATSLRLHLNVATVLPVATLTSALYDLYCINDVRDLGGLGNTFINPRLVKACKQKAGAHAIIHGPQ